tara:strand:+ start:9627 stop:9869 length:243 start_codon:yes stop_codon:yes gene_type:complete
MDVAPLGSYGGDTSTRSTPTICPRKSRPIKIDLPKVETAADVTAAQSAVIVAMAKADITPEEASTIAGVLEAKRRAIETI